MSLAYKMLKQLSPELTMYGVMSAHPTFIALTSSAQYIKETIFIIPILYLIIIIYIQ